jgi:hypothetical protein
MLNDDVITDVKGGKWACGVVVMEGTKFSGAECAFFENSGSLLPLRHKRTTMCRDEVTRGPVKDHLRRGCASGNGSITEEEEAFPKLVQVKGT